MAEEFVGPDVTGDGVNDADITDAGDFVNIGGVIFTDAVNTGSGTGNYNTFLAISDNDGVEHGFNSDDTPPIDDSNENIDQAKTHTVKLSDLVIVTVNGVQYYEFRVDLNESNSDPDAQISLDQFQLYSSSNGAIVDTGTLFTQNLIYDMDAGGNKSVLLSDASSSGSGTDDYSVLVPITEFAGLDPTTTYVYLFVQMGAAGEDWETNATFEEWNLQNGVTLTGTKFEDLDGDGVKDAGEGPVAGVTIFIDANKNGVLDAGERTTVTDASGNYTFHGVATGQTVWIDEVVPDGATQTTGTHEVIVIGDAAPGSILVVDPIGNFIPSPEISITKSASVPGDCADTAGELITYTIVLDNTGNVALDTVVVTDSFEGGSEATLTVTGDDGDGILEVGEVWLSGDVGNDGIMGVTETWTYTYVRAVTQAQIDSDGGGDGTLDDLATANAEQINSAVAADEVSDDASVDVCPEPELAIDKVVQDVGGDGAAGIIDEAGDVITYDITVTNTGNVTLTNVTITDPLTGGLLHTVPSLAPGASYTHEDATYTVLQSDIDSNGTDEPDDVAAGLLDNTARADSDQTGEVTDSEDVPIDQNPELAINKVVQDVGGDGAAGIIDEAGDVITYDITVTNTGNVTLTNVTITDPLTGGLLHTVPSLAPGASYTHEDATYTVLQSDIDSNGTDEPDDVAAGLLDNTARADSDQTGEVTDSEDVPIDQNPLIDIEKDVRTDVSGVFADEDDPDGPAASTSSTVDFRVTLRNTGNVTLTNITLTDSVIHTEGGVSGSPVDIDYSDPSLGAFIDLNGNATLDAGEEWTNFDTDSDGTLDIDENGDPFELSVGEEVTIYYSLTAAVGQHENTVVVTADAATSGEDATDSDDANYLVLASEDCVGVRTPGFWSNSKWMTFWDGKGEGWGSAPNEPINQAGTPGFADGELLYKVFLTDSNGDGVINGDPSDGVADDAFVKGLLIGDYNQNGITDAGEDTIFISYDNALKLINASSKQIAGSDKTSDGTFMLGRDMVATWLNYLANNQESVGECIGDVDPNDGLISAREYLDAAIDWMQALASDDNSNAGNAQSVFEFDNRVAPSSANWQSPIAGVPFSGSTLHSQLDLYNNTGAIFDGIDPITQEQEFTEYCCDADSHVALSALAQIHLV